MCVECSGEGKVCRYKHVREVCGLWRSVHIMWVQCVGEVKVGE